MTAPSAPATTATGGPAGRPWLRAVAATGLAWLLTMLVVVVATGLPHNETVPVVADQGFAGLAAPDPEARGMELLRTGLLRFDALWYVAIASDGYPTTAAPPQAAAFFPGYPLVVAGVAAVLGGRVVTAALLVAFAATVATVVGMRRLAALVVATNERVAGDDLPGTAVLLTLVFPTGFFLLAPYAESLLLAASVWALVHAAEGRPWASAALAAAAATIRPTGALLAVPLVLGVLGGQVPGNAWWRDASRRAAGLRRWVVPALGPVAGLLAVAVHGWVSWGDPLAVVNAQGGWQRELTMPLVTLARGVEFGLQALGDGSTPYHLLDLVVLALTLAGTVALARRREWPLALHAAISVLLWLSQPFVGRPLMSTPRFALALPGVMIGLACAASSTWGRRVMVPVCSVLFAIHLVLFSRWWFVF